MGERNEFKFSDEKLVEFAQLSRLLNEKYDYENTGMIFVAGAEGHKGHVHAAKYMSNIVPVTIWGFEQEEYMQRKERKAPFLPLNLRLSMWFYETSVTYLTVLPKSESGIYDNDHYNGLFIQSGAKYFFVHEKDPYLQDKLSRGRQDLDHIIRQHFPVVSTTEAVKKLGEDASFEDTDRMIVTRNLRIIPDLPIDSTTNIVKRLKERSEKFEGCSESFINEEVVVNSFRIESIGFHDTLFVE